MGAPLGACTSAAPPSQGTVDAGSYDAIVPPARPGASSTGGATKWFAMKTSHLGLTDKATGATDPNAWKTFGFDLDGRDTTSDDSVNQIDTCKRAPGALTRFLMDGNGGIDNNFGQHVMPVIHDFKADVEQALNQAIASGKSTVILRLDNVGPADNANVPGALYLTGAFSTGSAGAPTPTFTASDAWPIDPSSLVDGKTIAQPKVVFAQGYMAGGLWVSGPVGANAVDLALLLGGLGSTLPIESPTLVASLDGSTQGTIAGAITTATLQTALTPVARRLGICPGSTIYQDVVSTLSSAADLVSGGAQLQDVTTVCDAIAIGIGFDVTPTGEPTKVAATGATTATDPCADAGTSD
ncbi:MAG: hypothetical protein ACHREM_17830 [Polyangiales bacterium]